MVHAPVVQYLACLVQQCVSKVLSQSGASSRPLRHTSERESAESACCMAVLCMISARTFTLTWLQGIDSFGVDRKDMKELDFASMQVPVPIGKLKSVEFKRTFRIPDHAPQGNKISSGTYNHPWPLTDMLICWDMKWDKAHQASDSMLVTCKKFSQEIEMQRCFPVKAKACSLWLAILTCVCHAA